LWPNNDRDSEAKSREPSASSERCCHCAKVLHVAATRQHVGSNRRHEATVATKPPSPLTRPLEATVATKLPKYELGQPTKSRQARLRDPSCHGKQMRVNALYHGMQYAL